MINTSGVGGLAEVVGGTPDQHEGGVFISLLGVVYQSLRLLGAVPSLKRRN